jgi:hypothetical protein
MDYISVSRVRVYDHRIYGFPRYMSAMRFLGFIQRDIPYDEEIIVTVSDDSSHIKSSIVFHGIMWIFSFSISADFDGLYLYMWTPAHYMSEPEKEFSIPVSRDYSPISLNVSEHIRSTSNKIISFIIVEQ